MATPTDGGLPLDINQRPAQGVYVPNIGTVAAQGGSILTDSSNQPYAPVVTQTVLTGPSGDAFNTSVFAPGELRVALEASQLFYDAFDTGLDTTNRWNSPTTGNSGVAASNTVGSTVLGSGTSANGYSVLQSQMSFLQANPGYVMFAMLINIEFPVLTNAYRFWGFATNPGTPTTAAPLTEAAGFEIGTNGKMAAVTYQTGTRVLIQDLSASTGTGKQPVDSNVHKYFMFYRGDNILWCIDSFDNVVAQTTTGANGPNVNALPLKALSVGGATPPASSATITINAVWTGDTARNSHQISDGVFTWRKATITALHNQDNQALPTSPASYGLLTGGVAQLINPLGNLDRQREAGQDQVSALGISLGSTAFAQNFATTVPTTGTITQGTASATVTPASMTGIMIGTILTVDVGANAESAVVTALPTASTATLVPTNGSPAAPSFLHGHTPSYSLTGFLFNQERDASGENSGASGKGTAVAAEYEWNSGGPLAFSTGVPTLLQYDREVAALGKATVNNGAGFAISSTTAGNTSFTLTTPANGATLTPGAWVRLSGAANAEYVRVADSYTIASAPASVPVTSAIVNTGQTLATWDAFGANGPGQNPVLWTGEGFEGVLLNDTANPGFARAWQGDTLGNAKVTYYGGTKASYTYAISATAPYATPTDWIVIRGSSTKTIKIMHIEISGAATAATEVIFTINKHTVANTAGTSTTPTPMLHDSNDSAASATVLLYSAAPTINGSATIWKNVRLTLAVAPAATSVNPDRYVYDYAAQPYEPLTLRGVAQECAINFAGAAVPSGGVYDVAITWTEE